MPEGYTHVRTAQKAAAALHHKIRCPAAFAAGANGPDLLFCFEAWKPGHKRRYDLPRLGNRMHEEKTGAFLRCLCRRVKTTAQVEYAMGFLSHYAADTVLHPYVCAMCAPGMPYAGPGGHGYFEIALDSTLHAEDTGEGRIPADEVSPLPVGQELSELVQLLHDCLLEVYDEDIPIEYLADAFYYTNRLRRMFPSRHGVRKVVFWLIEPLFGGRGTVTGHLSPRKLADPLPEQWTDPFTGTQREETPFDLLVTAQQRSEEFIRAALKTWMGKLSREEFEALLGSMSYTQGIATPQSDPDADWPQETPPEPEAAPEQESAPQAPESAAQSEAAQPGPEETAPAPQPAAPDAAH